jgi:transposase-like protein
MAKRYPAKLKFQFVMEAPQGEKSAEQVAKAHGVHPNSLNRREQEFPDKRVDILTKRGLSRSTKTRPRIWSR